MYTYTTYPNTPAIFSFPTFDHQPDEAVAANLHIGIILALPPANVRRRSPSPPAILPAGEHPAAIVPPAAVLPSDAALLPEIIPIAAPLVIITAEEAAAIRTQVLLDFNYAPYLRHVDVDTWSLADIHSVTVMHR